MIRELSLNTIGVSDLKTFWNIIKPILFGLLVVVCVFSLVVISIVICVHIKHLDDPKETTAYIDYAPLPLNVTYTDVESDLNCFAYTKDSIDRFEYYKINGLPLEDFVGANAVEVALFGGAEHKIVLANPDKQFSLWNDWTIKEIQIKREEDTYATEEISVKNDFLSFAKKIDGVFADDETNISNVTNEENYSGDIIGSGSLDFSVSFEENEYVEWRTRISYCEYSDGKFNVKAKILVFDSYPDIRCKEVEIPDDTPLYDFIVESINNSK